MHALGFTPGLLGGLVPSVMSDCADLYAGCLKERPTADGAGLCAEDRQRCETDVAKSEAIDAAWARKTMLGAGALAAFGAWLSWPKRPQRIYAAAGLGLLLGPAFMRVMPFAVPSLGYWYQVALTGRA